MVEALNGPVVENILSYPLAHGMVLENVSLIGNSPAMRRMIRLIEKVAPSSASAIIAGESGTGKELVARIIHERSPRRQRPFVTVNCAAIPEALMESELFGHERGAFTGAERRQMGRFEEANGGTLLLDEITEMKMELQAKLLRVVEEQTLRRLGGADNLALDVRVLATSNRDLRMAITESNLRLDLFHRLSVFVIELPNLRDRLEDLPLLVQHFIEEYGPLNGKRIRGLEPGFIEALRAHSWPGNIRELRNVIERAVIISESDVLRVRDLPPPLQRPSRELFESDIGISLAELERQYTRLVLEHTGGNRVNAARILGVSVKTLRQRLRDSDRFPQSRKPR